MDCHFHTLLVKFQWRHLHWGVRCTWIWKICNSFIVSSCISEKIDTLVADGTYCTISVSYVNMCTLLCSVHAQRDILKLFLAVNNYACLTIIFWFNLHVLFANHSFVDHRYKACLLRSFHIIHHISSTVSVCSVNGPLVWCEFLLYSTELNWTGSRYSLQTYGFMLSTSVQMRWD